jgi:serine/threonine protein phosphatase PrpC
MLVVAGVALAGYGAGAIVGRRAAVTYLAVSTVTESPQTLIFPLGTPVLVAVADGLGGHLGGEAASALVVRRLAQVGPLLDSEDRLREALTACNREVYAAAERDPALTAMGTTVAGVVVTHDRVLAFNVDPHVITSPLSEDTSYLICTDGLTDPLPAGLLGEVLGQHEDGRAMFELWKAAIEAGGPDNITIALVRPAS